MAKIESTDEASSKVLQTYEGIKKTHTPFESKIRKKRDTNWAEPS